MNESNSDFQITPETKIGAMLERFPQLENVLIEMAPEFKKLHNPILRKTVVRVTSLRQAAALGKVALPEMINRLRAEVGLKGKFDVDDTEDIVSRDEPAWFSPSRIVKSFDARSMLEAGEQPIQRVFAECRDLTGGDIYELITPFLPAPLIESAREKGFLTWATEDPNSVFKTYLTPNQ
ncbi:DUF1858 domain-containing protein [Acidobacteriota bacterium]